MMSRKDYILIAAALHTVQLHITPGTARATFNNAVNKLADALATDNPRFNRERFLTAAGVSE